MIQDQLHRQINRNLPKVEAWFKSQRQDIAVPFYSSYDIRDSSYKVANVDANIFPAGFNNICAVDRENGGELVRYYLDRHYGAACKRLLILTEEHTNNPFYWENVRALKELISSAGYEVRLGVPRAGTEAPVVRETATGVKLEVCAVVFASGRFSVCGGYEPDLIISNNDFSEFYEEWGREIVSPMNPPRELGWYQRKKSTYFRCYNKVAREFAEAIEVDPFFLTVETELMPHFDMGDDTSRDTLAKAVDKMILRLRTQYRDRGITQEPFVFVKNNSGTYGLGVMSVRSGEDVMSLNYKTRKKMKAAKGGRGVEEVILQEGIPSSTTADGVTAEPAIYMLGCQLLGGFLRAHKEKDETESLNSPGAVYKRLCVSDLKVSVEGHPMENVYGWVAMLGVLAIGLETSEMGITYRNYALTGLCG